MCGEKNTKLAELLNSEICEGGMLSEFQTGHCTEVRALPRWMFNNESGFRLVTEVMYSPSACAYTYSSFSNFTSLHCISINFNRPIILV